MKKRAVIRALSSFRDRSVSYREDGPTLEDVIRYAVGKLCSEEETESCVLMA